MQWQLRAAMAAADITPEEDVYLEGYEPHSDVSLARYPQDFTSDLKARVLILDNGTDRFVMVNLELLFADVEQYGTLSENFSDKVARICETVPENVLLSNTHTHHAPRRLGLSQENRILEAVEEAYLRLAPASIRVGRVHTAYGVSRSRDYSIDYTRPYDDELTVLRLETLEGEPIGLVFHVPIHNTMYAHGPDLRENRHRLNCEFTGYACRYLEAKMGKEASEFVAMHVNGFYGNSGPVFRERYYAPSLEELREAGKALGTEVLEGWEKAEKSVAAGPIRAVFQKAELDTRQDDRAFAPCFGDFVQEPVRIHAGAFGELATVAVNYEPFSIIGARLKAEAPFKVILPAAGMGWRGYIPTKETFLAHKVQKEVECEPIKTPLTEAAEERFYGMLLQAVCDLREVIPCRIPAKAMPCVMDGEEAVYHFTFDAPVPADKLVIDFGQAARTDCACEFVVVVDDLQQAVSGFSSAYWGMLMGGKQVTQVQLRVKKRYLYMNRGIDRLAPKVFVICYNRKEEAL